MKEIRLDMDIDMGSLLWMDIEISFYLRYG